MRRHLALGIAAVVVFAAVGITAVLWLVHDVREKSAPPLDDVRVVRAGFSIDAVLVAKDDRHLTVATRTQACGTPHLVAKESDSEVVVGIDLPDARDPLTACNGTPPPSRYSTVLSRPVGDRRIMDSFGDVVPRIDATRLLEPQYLPSGYRLASEDLLVSATVQSTYTRAGSSLHIVVEQGPGQVDRPGVPASGRASVPGASADVYRAPDRVTIIWTSGGSSVSVAVDGPTSTASRTAVQVARSLVR